LYEGTYLLGTSIARPLIAKRQIEIAKMVGSDHLPLGFPYHLHTAAAAAAAGVCVCVCL
jgi:hypothetical protein